MRNIKQEICKELSRHCNTLNDAHKRPDHSELEKNRYYQRYIGEMDMLNELAKRLKVECRCKEIKVNNKHVGHKMVKK